MLESSVTKKGQTTLPKSVRETLGVGAGDRVRYLILDGEVRILPVRPIHRLFGVLEHDGPPVSLEQMDEACPAEGAQEYLRSTRRPGPLPRAGPAPGGGGSRSAAVGTADKPAYACREVVVELDWVLERAYGYSRVVLQRSWKNVVASEGLVVRPVGEAAFR